MFRQLLFGFLSVALFRITTEYVDGGRQKIQVGVLFFHDEEDIELSFDAAFNEINNLKFFTLHFEAIKRYVPSDDSLILQQLTCELMASGVAAIFGPSSKSSSDIVEIITNAAGIPHIQFDWRVQEPIRGGQHRSVNQHATTVNVAPALSILSRAYSDIVRSNYAWKAFTIVYESEEGLARLQDILDVQALDRDFIKLRKISDYESDYRVLWKEAAETYHEHHIVLDCSPEMLVPLLETAIEFNLLGSFNNWFLTHLDTHSSRLRHVYNEAYRANITSVRLKITDPNPYERKKTRITRVDEILGNQTMLPILIYDSVILYANAAHRVLGAMRKYEPPYRQCDIDIGRVTSQPWYEGKLIVNEMKNISEDDIEPGLKTENLQLNKFGQRTEFNIEIYKPTVNEPLAVWKSDGSISPIRVRFPELLETSSPQDFSQTKRIYTVVTHFEKPYFMLKADHENLRGDEKYEGYAVDLIKKLSEILDFDYKFMIVNGNGKYNPATREWDGVIGKLISHHAQIGICDITITQSRRQVVDFTVPFMQLGISILYYKEPPKPKDLFAFLDPFAPEVWTYMMLTQLVMTLLFMLMARISIREWEGAQPFIRDPDQIENKWATSNSFWLMIGSIMQQGCDILPRGPPMRILTGMWWFFALMMLNSYTANLAAVLTSNKMQPTISGLDDLINQNKVKFGTLAGGATSMFFSESNETVYSRAWNQMKSFQPSAFTASNNEGVDRVRKGEGNYAFFMETTGLSYNMAQHCDLMQIGSQIGEKHYGIAVPLGADYRLNLSVSILQLSEKGELYRLKNKWWKNSSVTCEKFDEVDGDELSIIELGGVFLVLAGGVVVSAIIGLFEFLWNVEHVAVEQKLTPAEALKAEFTFFFKFWIKRKPVRIATISSSKSSVSTTGRRSSKPSRSPTRSRTRSRSRSTQRISGKLSPKGP